MSTKCVVLVVNDAYFQKAVYTIYQLRTVGQYVETVVLITDESSYPNIMKHQDVLSQLQIQVQVFEEMDLTYIMEKIRNETTDTESNRGKREVTKTFQWHKIHVFDVFFKQWQMIFYLDAGIQIYNPIEPFWEILTEYGCGIRSIVEDNHAYSEGLRRSPEEYGQDKKYLIAHSDTYPEPNYNYSGQFKQKSYPDIFQQLTQEIDLSGDHFQSTILLFHSNIIRDETKNELMFYANKYPISRTNEQAIMNIYFNGIYPLWKPLPPIWKKKYTYDFMNRGELRLEDYIMTKYDRRNF